MNLSMLLVLTEARYSCSFCFWFPVLNSLNPLTKCQLQLFLRKSRNYCRVLNNNYKTLLLKHIPNYPPKFRVEGSANQNARGRAKVLRRETLRIHSSTAVSVGVASLLGSRQIWVWGFLGLFKQGFKVFRV